MVRWHFKWSILVRFLLLLPVLWFAIGGQVRAQGQKSLQLIVTAGLDGYCKENRWLPVRVQAENSGAEIRGEIQLSYINSNNGLSVYAEEVILPTTSRKEITLYFFPEDFIRNLKVSVVSGRETLVTQAFSLSCIGAENTLVGLLTDSPASFDMLNEITPLKGSVKTAPLQIQDLPDKSEVWMSLDVLIISGGDMNALSAEQRAALTMWIANGGRLMVTGGPAWQGNTAGLGDLLPVEVNSERTVEGLHTLSDYLQVQDLLEGEIVLAVGKVREGASVLVEEGGVPLLVEREIGFGKVIYFAADPTLNPLADWDGLQAMYGHLLMEQPAKLNWTSGIWDDYAVSNVATVFDNSGLPSALFICCWLLLYVLIIGPINFFVVRRLKKPERAWLTIPVLVVMFSAVAYFYGFVYRGQRPILNRVAVIQAWEGVETASVRGVVGLYSPRRGRFTISAEDGFLMHPLTNMDATLQSGDGWLSLKTDDQITAPDISVEIGGVQSVQVKGAVPALQVQHDLVLSMDTTPKIRGSVTNNSSYTLRDALIVSSGNWMDLGDLTPGATSKPINLSFNNLSDNQFYQSDAYTILGSGYGYPLETEETRRQQILNMVMETSNYRYYGSQGNWGVYLIGWVEDPLLPVQIQDERFDTVDTALYVIRLDPAMEFSDDPWKFTPGLMVWESSSASASPYYISEIPTMGVYMNFRPIIPVQDAAVDSLILDINSIYGGVPTDIAVSFWDHNLNEWVKVEGLTWGANDIPEPQSFVGPGGIIRLRVVSQTSSYLEFDSARITLVVKP